MVSVDLIFLIKKQVSDEIICVGDLSVYVRNFLPEISTLANLVVISIVKVKI